MRASLLLPCLLFAATSVLAQDVREFKKRFPATKNSWERRALILQLDPADDAGFKLLTRNLLRSRDWYMRWAAVDRLAKADAAVVAKLKKLRDTPGLEGAVWALGKARRRAHIPWLIEQLRSKKWLVRRAAAIALARLPDRRSIEALIAAWEKEKAFRVWIHCLESLEAITGEQNKRTARAWRGWWRAVGDSFKLPGERTKAAADKAGGYKTRVRGTRIHLKSRGRGLPLLVLPEYGYEQSYLETYLRDLEDTNQILYMKLPGATDFTDPKLKKAPDLPDPYYPIDRIVASLEALHAELVEKKKIKNRPFALLAHGLTCWIAMTYAAKHPKKVRKMVLVAPYSGGAAWDAGRLRVEALGKKLGDQEMEHFAQNQLYDGYKTSGPKEDTALERKEFSLYFANQGDLMIGRLWGPVVTKTEDGTEYEARKISRLLGTVVIPEFELKKLPRVRVPTVIAHGDRSVRTSLEDAQVIAKHYGAAKVIRFPRSARVPFIESHDKFVKAMKKFLRK